MDLILCRFTDSLFLQVDNKEKWKMSFVMPSKYGSDLPLPQDSKVTIREVPKKIVAVVAFSGWFLERRISSDSIIYNSHLKVENSASLNKQYVLFQN